MLGGPLRTLLITGLLVAVAGCSDNTVSVGSSSSTTTTTTTSSGSGGRTSSSLNCRNDVCTLKVSGMTCAGCEVAVRLAARSVDGVQDVKVSYAKGKADVTYDPAKTNPADIAKVITKKSGFTAEPLPPPSQKPVVKGE